MIIEKNPAFADYQRKTTRRIPVVILTLDGERNVTGNRLDRRAGRATLPVSDRGTMAKESSTISSTSAGTTSRSSP
jgi:hypothetical protein